MDKRFLRNLEDQFGGYFVCSCSAPFDRSRFEIVKETNSSLVAHYTCARCGKDHVMIYSLATTLTATVQTDMEAHEVNKFVGAMPISADDVLEVRGYFKKFKGNFRAAFKIKEFPETSGPGSIFTLSS